MCQLNLYLISNEVPVNKVLAILNTLGYPFELVDFYKIEEKMDDYNLYATEYHCNCTSIISKFSKSKIKNFEEYKMKTKEKQLKEWNKIKTLMEEKDYKEKRNEFDKERERLFSTMDKLDESLLKYEVEESERIFKLDIPGENQWKMIQEEVYPTIDKMRKEIESTDEYKKAYQAFMKYLRQNKWMEKSTYYDLEEQKKIIESEDYAEEYKEYDELKRMYQDMLKITDKLEIYPFWQHDKKIKIKGTREVNIKDIKIEDLVFHPYEHLLIIKK